MPLNHEEQKAHRIMINDSAHGVLPLPNVDAYRRILSYRMNKTEDEVEAILESLDEKEYIVINHDKKVTVNKK